MGPSGVTPSTIQAVPLDAPLEVPTVPSDAPTPEALLTSIDALERAVSLPQYDLAAQARSLGGSLDSAFSFVRDKIRYEAYSGVLRDASGTLAARAGNAFDRARLLASLLQTQGVRTRFATGTLPRDRAEALFAHVFDGFTAVPSLNPGQASPFLKRLLTRGGRDYTAIRPAVGTALSESIARARAQALEDITRHIWVQAQVDGRWLDLDAAFPDSKPGRTYAPVSQTVDDMPVDWFQRVVIRVNADRLEDGALSSATLLDVTRTAVELANRDVFLLHAPAARQSMGLGAAGASAGDRWTPIVLLGDETLTGEAVDFSDAGGSAGFFDALGGGSESAFVAEWLEFEVILPNGRRDVTRRTIADRATAVWRATSPLQPDTLAPLVGDTDGLVTPRAVHHLLFSTGPLNLGDYLASASVVVFGDEKLFGEEAPLVDRLFPLTVRDTSSLVWTENVIVPALNDAPNVRLYSGSPRIRVVTMSPGPDGDVSEIYDLRRDSPHVLARGAGDDGIAADRTILFAALEGALEHETVARDISLLDGDPGQVESTSAALTDAGVVIVTSADLSRLSSVSDHPETVARLRAAFSRDGARLLVAPRAALGRDPAAWWEVSASGAMRAVAGANLNESKSHGRLTPGGQQPTIRPTTPTTHPIPRDMTAREARLAQNRANLARFYRDLPARRAAQARQRGLEYGMLVAMVVATIAFVAYLAYDYHKRAVDLAHNLEAIRAGAQSP